jgi:hypothetical protein
MLRKTLAALSIAAAMAIAPSQAAISAGCPEWMTTRLIPMKDERICQSSNGREFIFYRFAPNTEGFRGLAWSFSFERMQQHPGEVFISAVFYHPEQRQKFTRYPAILLSATRTIEPLIKGDPKYEEGAKMWGTILSDPELARQFKELEQTAKIFGPR